MNKRIVGLTILLLILGVAFGQESAMPRAPDDPNNKATPETAGRVEIDNAKVWHKGKMPPIGELSKKKLRVVRKALEIIYEDATDRSRTWRP